MKITSKEIAKRLNSYTQVIKKHKLDGLILSSTADIVYTTQFKHRIPTDREALAFLSIQSDTPQLRLFIPRMFNDQVQHTHSQVITHLIKHRKTLLQSVKPYINNKKIGFDGNDLRFSEYSRLSKLAASACDVSRQLSTCRQIKSDFEISLLSKAEQITQQALTTCITRITANTTEKQLARMLIDAMEELGADGISFEPIVASGKASAIPHYQPQHIPIAKSRVLLVDLGATYKGYCGDLTRTYAVGSSSPSLQKTYALVDKAQQAALKAIVPGKSIADIDTAVRTVFAKHSQEECFLHSTGHGVGLQIHETPAISYLSKDIITPGMVITIEPGLYYSDWGGVRIEDMIVVTKSGYKYLSKPQPLQTLII